MTGELRELISGGQTGVDRAALDVAVELGLEHGGWCPRGRRAEDGAISPRYRLRETEQRGYRHRTRRNVQDSEATLVLTVGEPRGGTALTLRLARAAQRPVLVVDLNRGQASLEAQRVRAWLREHAVARLNVAGPRESSSPGVAERAAGFLRLVLVA